MSTWQWKSTALGGLIGGVVAAVMFLLKQEATPVLWVLAPVTAAVCLGLAVLLAIRNDEKLSTTWILLGVLTTAVPGYRAFKWLIPVTTAHDAPRHSPTQLPGFSVVLAGTEQQRLDAEYDHGWVDAWDRSVATTVLWKVGSLSADGASAESAAEWLELFDYDDPITVSDHDHEPSWPDRQTRTYKLFVGLHQSDATFLECGARLLAVYTAGTRRLREKAHRRTVASIRCAPDPAEEVLAGKPPPVKIAPPEEWKPVGDDPFWARWSDGTASLLFTFRYRGREMLGDMPAMVTDELGGWGTVALEGSERVGEIELWRGTLIEERGAQHLLAYLTTCRGRPMLAVLFGWEITEEARAALLGARCE